MSGGPPILYFSKQCPNCNKFLSIAQSAGILSQLMLVDVDRQQYPEWVSSVPTLLMPTGQKIVGKHALSWAAMMQSVNRGMGQGPAAAQAGPQGSSSNTAVGRPPQGMGVQAMQPGSGGSPFGGGTIIDSIGLANIANLIGSNGQQGMTKRDFASQADAQYQRLMADRNYGPGRAGRSGVGMDPAAQRMMPGGGGDGPVLSPQEQQQILRMMSTDDQWINALMMQPR